RARAEALLKTDAGFAAAVQAWENRMEGLNDGFADIRAPDLLPVLEARLFGKPARRAPFWRSWIAGAAVAAALGVVVLALLPAPNVFAPVATLTAAAQDLRYEAAYDGQRLRIARVAGAPAGAGLVHELWLIVGDAAPVSLGLIEGDSLQLDLPGAAGGMVLAVSLEPAGGSVTGAPTGPVLVTGVIVQG
ncbi:MAG: anti-sigma factor, partial [Paracoccaceae bacterium]|nr:anti-sigma factor [Paracoccaceae bacterium]